MGATIMASLVSPLRRLAVSGTTTTALRETKCSTIPPTTSRTFTSTPASSRQKPSYLTVPEEQVPDYPHGEYRTYKQRNRGLYGNAKILFGNTVTGVKGKKRSPRKSPAQWRPNRHTKRLWSVALQAFIRTRLTTPVLKTIDKLGGIDEYLLGNKSKRIKELGPAGWALRWKIMQTDAVRARFAAERAALGLPPQSAEQERADLASVLAAEADAILEGRGNASGEDAGVAIENDGAYKQQMMQTIIDNKIVQGEEIVLEMEDGEAAAQEAKGEVIVEKKEDIGAAAAEAEGEVIVEEKVLKNDSPKP